MTCTRCHKAPGQPRRKHAERVMCDACSQLPPIVEWQNPPPYPGPPTPDERVCKPRRHAATTRKEIPRSVKAASALNGYLPQRFPAQTSEAGEIRDVIYARRRDGASVLGTLRHLRELNRSQWQADDADLQCHLADALNAMADAAILADAEEEGVRHAA